MRTRKRVASTIGAMLMLAAFAVPQHAGAAGTPAIVSGPGSWLTTYTQPVIAISPGDKVQYYNLDAMPHDVIADVSKSGGSHTRPDDSAIWCSFFPSGSCPLFWSALIPVAQNTPVLGLEDAVPGTVYDFYCSIHGGMFGKLVVLPA